MNQVGREAFSLYLLGEGHLIIKQDSLQLVKKLDSFVRIQAFFGFGNGAIGNVAKFINNNYENFFSLENITETNAEIKSFNDILDAHNRKCVVWWKKAKPIQMLKVEGAAKSISSLNKDKQVPIDVPVESSCSQDSNDNKSPPIPTNSISTPLATLPLPMRPLPTPPTVDPIIKSNAASPKIPPPPPPPPPSVKSKTIRIENKPKINQQAVLDEAVNFKDLTDILVGSWDQMKINIPVNDTVSDHCNSVDDQEWED